MINSIQDLLDEFSTTKKQSREESQAQSLRTHEKSDSQSSEVHTATNDFNQQLQDQMAALLGEVDESPDMVRDIEAMMQELGVAADTSPATGTQNGTPNAVPPPGVETPFQKTIWEAMERIQTSGEQAPPAVPKDSDDLLAQMLKEMQGGDSGAAGSEEEFSKMLMGMMEHLTNKDILYDPMKELHDKFPQWMDRNRGKLSADDLQRYETQQRLVKDIVLRFEQKTYTDANVEDREYIVERMQQVLGNLL